MTVGSAGTLRGSNAFLAPRMVSLLLVCLIAQGCAFAPAPLVGGETTPHRRTDLAAGGSMRAPTGKLRGSSPGAAGTLQESSSGRGVSPMVLARYGVAEHLDLELGASGTHGRVGARREWVLGEGVSITRPALIVGGQLSVGRVFDSGDGDNAGDGGLRFSIDVPVTLSVDFGSVYEAWVGWRVGVDHVRGDFVPAEAVTPVNGSANGLRTGPVLGLAVGQRRVHAMIEVTVAYEHWWIDLAGTSTRGGIVFIPAFALRVRI